MATGDQVETLTGFLAREKPKSDRDNVTAGLMRASQGIAGLSEVKALLDTVVADAAAAGEDSYELEQVQNDWASNLVSKVSSGFSHGGNTGINAIAQLLADLSEQAGLEGGPNRLRLFTGQPGSEAILAVDQDA